MADFTAEQPLSGGMDSGRMATYLGGVLSLALIAGTCVWGAKLVMRDVTGIPVVQAAQGPMRVASEDPGGVVADNSGLSVNAVAAQGTVAAPEERVVLAPEDSEIVAQDLQSAPSVTETPATTDVAPTGIVEASALTPLTERSEDEVQSMVDQILAGVSEAPLTQDTTPEAPAAQETPAADDPNMVTVMINGTPVQTRRAGSSLAVAVSLRPVARKAAATEVASRSTTSPATAPIVAPQSLPAGTPLAQIGAYDAETVAATEWGRFSDAFPELMADLTPVVQRAQSGGKVFYRLRARGFADIGAARRFCSALTAQKTDCIPVVSR